MADLNPVIKVTVDSSQAMNALGQIQSSLKGLEGGFSKVAAAAEIFTAALAVDKIIEMADQMVSLDNKLKSLTTSTDDYQYASTAVVAVATQTRQSIYEVGNSFGRLEVVMGSLGYTQKTIADSLQTFIEYQNAAGASTALATRGMNEFINALERGSFQYRDIRQLLVAAPNFLKDLQDALGMTADQFMFAAHNGTLSSGMIIEAMKGMKDHADSLQASLTPTFGQGFTLMNNALTVAVGHLNEATGASKAFMSISKFFADNIGAMIGALVGLSVAIGGLLLVLVPAATAMAVLTGGVAVAGAIAAGAALGYAADQAGMFGDHTSEASKQLEAFNKNNSQIDNPQKRLTEQQMAAIKALDDYITKTTLLAKIEGSRYQIGVLQYEINKAIAEEEAKMEKVHSSLSDGDKQRIAAAITMNVLSKEKASMDKSILDLTNSNIQAAIVDTDQRKIQVELDKMKLQYSTETYDKYKGQVQALMEQNALIEAQTKIRAVTAPASVSETGTAAANILGNDTQQGIIAQQDKQLQAIRMLKEQGAIDTKQYNDLEIQAEMSKNDAILALDQKLMANRMRLAGVTNQGILDAVKQQQANVAMIQQGGVVGLQGALGAMDQLMTQMGTQNRKAFETHKALATVQAIISTYQAAAMSIAAPPGPPFSYIYVATAIAAGMAQVAAIQSQSYSGRAVGGPVSGNQPYIVGERGPEMFVPPGAGTIVPNSQLGGGGPTNINFTIQAVDARGVDNLLMERKGMIVSMIRSAINDRGQRAPL